MKMIINLDPHQITGIDKLAQGAMKARHRWVRDAIYTQLWHARHGGPPMLEAPLFESVYLDPDNAKLGIRAFKNGPNNTRLARVDDWGLEIVTESYK